MSMADPLVDFFQRGRRGLPGSNGAIVNHGRGNAAGTYAARCEQGKLVVARRLACLDPCLFPRRPPAPYPPL